MNVKTVQKVNHLHSYDKVLKYIFSICIDVTLTTEQSGRPCGGYLSQLVVAEVQVDQRVELTEASKSVQLVASQAQGFDVT